MSFSLIDHAIPLPVQWSHDASKNVFPRMAVAIAGTIVTPTQIGIDLYTFGIADTATVTLPVTWPNGPDVSGDGTPDWSVMLQSADWASPIPIQIFIGFPAIPAQQTVPSLDGMMSVFLGQIDKYTVDFGADPGTVKFQARSFAAILQDDRIQTYASGSEPAQQGQLQVVGGMTTIDFLGRLCAIYNFEFAPDLQKNQKPLLVTDVYSRDVIVGLQNKAPWEIAVDCAQADDVSLWVDGTKLFYVTPSRIPTQRKSMTYGHDLLSFTGEHSPTFNKNVLVQVKSYNPKTYISHAVQALVTSDGIAQEPVTSTRKVGANPFFGRNARLSPSGVVHETQGGAVRGLFNSKRPNPLGKMKYVVHLRAVDPATANRIAKVIASQISRFEFSAEFSVAITPDILPYLNVRTLWYISGLPWIAFNTPQGPQASPPLASADPKVAAALAEIQKNDPSWLVRAYRSRHVSIKFEVPQGDSGGGACMATISGPNHPLPAGGD